MESRRSKEKPPIVVNSSFASFFHKNISVTLLTSRVPVVLKSDSVEGKDIKKKHQVVSYVVEEYKNSEEPNLKTNFVGKKVFRREIRIQ